MMGARSVPGAPGAACGAAKAGQGGQEGSPGMKTRGRLPASQAGRRDLEKAAPLGQGFSSLDEHWNHLRSFNNPRLQAASGNNLIRTLGAETQASVFFQGTPGYSSVQTGGRTPAPRSSEHVTCSFLGNVDK